MRLPSGITEHLFYLIIWKKERQGPLNLQAGEEREKIVNIKP